MNFSTQQLSSGKWGIYHGTCLLATTASQDTCEAVLLNLSRGRKDVSASDLKPYPQGAAPDLSSRREVSQTSKRTVNKTVSRLAKAKLKPERLEIASIETQKRHAVASEAAAATYRSRLSPKANHA